MDNSYTRRVHEVMDHVRNHVADDLRLDELARVAHFSPHHFHRIFTSVTGETVAAFTRRARLERAVYLMRGAPDRPLSSIGAEVGFATPSEFSRVFKAQFGCTPSSWDRRSRLDGRGDLGPPDDSPPAGAEPTAHIVERPPCRLAYVRVSDPWRGDHLAAGYARLTCWLSARAIPWRRRELVGVSWESGKATPLDRLVYDLGITVDPATTAGGEVAIHRFPAVRAVEVPCRTLAETARAWDFLYGTWLPGSGYEPAEVPALKRFRAVPEAIDASAWNVDCSIALRPQRP